MSQLMSMPGPSLMSQLIQPAGGSVPDPQFSRRTPCSAMGPHRPELPDQIPQHLRGVEMLLGYFPRGATVPRKVADHILERREPPPPGSRRQAAPRPRAGREPKPVSCATTGLPLAR